MSFSDYVAHGWHLCGLDSGQKGPTYKGWNVKPIAADAIDGFAGAGLLHVQSGTCAIDLDNLEAARKWFAERGVDLDVLREAQDSVHIDSGRPNRDKLLYRMTKPLQTVKPVGSGVELRCATVEGRSVQDVLPPSIHPETKKAYRWRYAEPLIGDYRNLPAIPANVLSIWRELAEPIVAAEPEAPKPAARSTITSEKNDALRRAVEAHDPNCEYDEWNKVGRQCHDATNGHIAGFKIWDAWSAKATRKQHGTETPLYRGRDALWGHWRSFKSTPGKRINSGAALLAEQPAAADEFPIVEAPKVAVNSKVPDSPGAAIKELIRRFVFVAMSECYFDAERNALIGFVAIQHLFTPFMPVQGRKKQDPVVILKESPHKRTVEAIAFYPGAPAIFEHQSREYANAWFDQKVEPLEPTALELEKIEWLFARISDPIFKSYLLQFYAHIVQRPSVKIRTAPLMWSKKEGNGKSTILHTVLKKLVGERFYAEANGAALNSDHNDYLEGKWAVGLTEFSGTRAERKEMTKKVEQWIADDMLAVNPKHRTGYSVPNHLVVTASSNYPDAAQLDAYNRKWAIHHFATDGAEIEPMTEAEKLWIFEEFLNTSRGPGVLRHYFLNTPITDFDPNADAPKTASRLAMISAAVPVDLENLTVAFEQRAEPFTREIVITQDVVDYLRRQRIYVSNDRVGKMLVSPPFDGVARQWRSGNGTFRGVAFDRKWLAASGAEIMAHINGENVDLLLS